MACSREGLTGSATRPSRSTRPSPGSGAGVWIESLRDVEGYLQRDGDHDLDLELEDPAPG
jgi:hypothetical protein